MSKAKPTSLPGLFVHDEVHEMHPLPFELRERLRCYLEANPGVVVTVDGPHRADRRVIALAAAAVRNATQCFACGAPRFVRGPVGHDVNAADGLRRWYCSKECARV